ncbi:suppressor of RPS4-RLD 1 isoform X2 [Ricinus communis]|uniref:suppressor of RPS4-RLD 1 isoform X2 n=1 Tax=Ricinus communis TaxID=3988 RepID=UPI00077253CD|nr:suppressor of RPS4-RLD 1 isoform X2 [Ricinus communis]|eukprot:XP_015578308.1 suppressor of RPS4-RLD 1 isoform X2 [Ricinus communis]
MASAISERVELAKLCASRDWSKAIRVLDSLLSQSCTIQDICNRAFCYSQLELHKHVIKDCDKALQLDPMLLQAYILKGRAFSSLGRKDDALLVWQQGYEHALRQSADLKQLLELEELLKFAKQERNIGLRDHVTESTPMNTTEFATHTNGKSNEASKNRDQLSDISNSCRESGDGSEICSKFGGNFDAMNVIRDKAGGESPITIPECRPHMNGKSDDVCTNHDKLGDKSKLHNESRDTYKICCNSGDNCAIQNYLSRKAEGDVKTDKNGTHNFIDKISDSESCNVLSDTSVPSSKSSTISISSGDTSDIRVKLSNKTDIPNEAGDETKKSKKFSVTRISKTKSITVDFRLSRGIAQVNEGKYASAISIFDQILTEDPTYPEALIGRGTAHAFQRELEAAIADFSKAIQSNPLAGEAWKRRGQARAALGESIEAIHDLTKALEFEPNSADILHERGIVNFKFKDFDAAVQDLSACVKLDKDNKSAYTYLGLALSSTGEYKKAEEAHLKSIQLDRSFLEGWAHLTQFYQDLANLTKAFECIKQVLQIDARFAKAYHLHGLLLHGMGEHRKAIKELSLGLSIENSNIECLYLRASCYHAIGEYGEAVKDYDATLDMELDSMEKFVLQCLAFYQKELALYTASKINSEFCWFDIDGDIDPLFKEYWCKRLHPKNVCEKVYRQPPLRDSLKRGKLRKQDFVITKQKTALLMAADSIGKKIQYDCPGFLPNRRQHRMAGLAAIEIAQKVSKAWRSLQAEWKHSNKSMSKYGKKTRRRINMPSQNRGGAGCSSNSSETSTSYGISEERSSGRHMISWQDVYSLAVKWRQISEPCDPVVWVNKLRREEFNTGFGSQTPLILGQAKVVRYYMNYERTLDAAKTIMKDKLYVHSKADEVIDISKDEKLRDIMDAKTCSELYKVIGEDFWLATWCNSTVIEGKRLEGTRITLMKMGEHGFDFAIRTPCTPPRWDEFDAEMAMAWEAVCNAYCGETYGSTDLDVLENVRDTILRMTYYWYNFMPLSRGSAAVGFIVLLGLLLAANMEFEGKIPKGIQVDWEAILNFEPSSFVDSIKSWLCPSLKVTTSWKDYPDVASTIATTGSVVAALSSYND